MLKKYVSGIGDCITEKLAAIWREEHPSWWSGPQRRQRNGVICVIHKYAQTAKHPVTLPHVKLVEPLLGDGKGQGWAVASAVATEVSGEVGGSVHDNLGCTGR